MLKKKNPNAAVWGHLFTARTPADVFFDFISLGEMYDSRVYKQRAYYNVLSPELMRIAYGTRTNECCISLIPQFLRSLECFEPEGVKTWDPFTPENDRAVRHYMAYCALFNLDHVFGVWLKGQRLPPDNKAHVTVYNRNMSKLGLDRNYSRNCRITPLNGKILACTYSGKGKMALVVLNDTDQQHDIAVAIPVALQKKFANACGTEIYKKSKHTLKNGVLKLKLAGRESAIILFE